MLFWLKYTETSCSDATLAPTDHSWLKTYSGNFFVLCSFSFGDLEFYSGCTTWTMMAQLTSRWSKLFLVLVFFISVYQSRSSWLCWQWWMGARRRRSFVRFSGFHRSEALFLKVWFAGSSMPIRMVWFLKMRWASLKKPWSLSAFELVGRYIHIHIVGHQVVIISDENFR